MCARARVCVCVCVFVCTRAGGLGTAMQWKAGETLLRNGINGTEMLLTGERAPEVCVECMQFLRPAL